MLMQHDITLILHRLQIFYALLWHNLEIIQGCTFYILFDRKGLKQRQKDKELEIFKIHFDDIILPWVADGVPMS